jgi:hypothetical protein
MLRLFVVFAPNAPSLEVFPSKGPNVRGTSPNAEDSRRANPNLHVTEPAMAAFEEQTGMAEVSVYGDAYSIDCTITVSGRKHEVFFRSDLPVLEPNGDVGVALGLFAAMRAREDLIVQAPVSRALLRNIKVYQEVVSTWCPELAPVDVKADAGRFSSGERVASFFSGGADSFFTAWKHRGSIDDWILVRGFDIPIKESADELWCDSLNAASRAAAEVGTRLVPVETNLRKLSDCVMDWSFSHGPALAAVGLAMRGNLGRLLIPSSHTYRDLSPYGSHPLLDPLWGGDGFEVVHDGSDKTRVEKMRDISSWPVAMKHLRVCFENVPHRYNCGACEKCLRTMVNLYVVGALGRCETLPGELDLKAIRRQFITDVNLRTCTEENLSALEETTEHLVVRKALKRTMARRLGFRARRKVYLQLRSMSYHIPPRARRRALDLLRRAMG